MKKLYFLLFIISLVSCKKDKSEDPQTKDPITSKEITYKAEAIILEKSVREAIESVDEERQIYTFKKSAFEAAPKKGEVILIPGELMRKVKSISSSGNNYVVHTEDASVTEVIENGSLSFDLSPEWSDVASLKMHGKEVLERGQKLAMTPINSKISFGGVTHDITITPTMSNGKINSCTFKFEMNKGGKTKFTAVGTATLPSQTTNIVIEKGKLISFDSKNKGIKATFKVEMATAGGESGEHSLKLPDMALSIPIRFIPTPSGPIPNPIPMSIDVGVQFVSQMTIPDAMSSALGKSSVSFDAETGFELKSATVDAVGSFVNSGIPDGTFDSAANFGMPIDLQFGMAFPRIGLNIAGQEVAFVHIGYTTGSKLTWGPLCKRGYSKMVIEGGYSLSVLGKNLYSGQKTFAEFEKRAGSDCD